MKAKEYPNKEYLNKIFRYDAESGVLYNRISRCGGVQQDTPAGSLHKSTGYLRVKIKRKDYLIHRIIWIMLNGSFDRNMQMDHIDHNRVNNKLGNLRLVTHAENGKNQKIARHNKFGHAGIGWYKRDRKWQANIRVKGKRIHLGYFKNKEDAIRVRKEAEIKYGFHKNHGGK